MTLLTFAAFFALIVGSFCLYAYIQDGNEIQLILSLANYGMAVIDFVVLFVNLYSSNN